MTHLIFNYSICKSAIADAENRRALVLADEFGSCRSTVTLSSMADFDSIADMMQSCADQAVRTARDRFGFELDYSEQSIESLETILASVSVNLNLLENDKVEEQVKLWGGYLGEVVRRYWNGGWDLIQYPGGTAAVPTLLVSGSQLYPLLKVYRRLTMGDGENVWKFYEQIRNRLATVHPLDGTRDAADGQ